MVDTSDGAHMGGGTIYQLVIVRCGLEGEATCHNEIGPMDNSRGEKQVNAISIGICLCMLIEELPTTVINAVGRSEQEHM